MNKDNKNEHELWGNPTPVRVASFVLAIFGAVILVGWGSQYVAAIVCGALCMACGILGTIFGNW